MQLKDFLASHSILCKQQSVDLDIAPLPQPALLVVNDIVSALDNHKLWAYTHYILCGPVKGF